MIIDTHIHIDGEEFDTDRDAVIARGKAAGVTKIFVPAIDLKSVATVTAVCRTYSDYAYPMIGLHPEEVRADWRETIDEMKSIMSTSDCRFIGIGEVGLDFYWSREYEREQLAAFEEQVRWSIETRLPLMIHCRKAQNEMVGIMKRYKDALPGGVFHCFTGNEREAAELLSFDNFMLGIGGVVTFKKSHLPEVVANIPLSRLVLETDAPYMAPVPHRGTRNESSFLPHVVAKIAEAKGVSSAEIEEQTTRNALRTFGVE